MAPTHRGPTLATPVPKLKAPDEMTNPTAVTQGACPSYAPTQLLRLSQSSEHSRHVPTQATIWPAFAYVAVARIRSRRFCVAPQSSSIRARTTARPDQVNRRQGLPSPHLQEWRKRRTRLRAIEARAGKRRNAVPVRRGRGRPNRSGSRWTRLTRGSILSCSKFQRNRRRADCAAHSEARILSESATRHHPHRIGVR
jgi:hypothetical protein